MTAPAIEDVETGENTHQLLVGVKICTATMEISVLILQKDETHSTSGSRKTILGQIPKEHFILSGKHLLNLVYCHSVHNS